MKCNDSVASRAEAWIETFDAKTFDDDIQVASRAEAWIETTRWARPCQTFIVASRAEAWIETFKKRRMSPSMQSPPVRRRGLKLMK